MAITLTKGQAISLDKKQNDLDSVTIGLGWKIAKKGFFASLVSNNDFDLDAIAILLDADGKVRNLGDGLRGSDVIFYNNLQHPSGHVYHSGDNRIGGAGVSDDEQIVVRLNSLGPQVHRILFLVSIYEGRRKGQNFGSIQQAFIRASDQRGREIARYNLAADPAQAHACTLLFGEVSRKGSDWQFRAIGDAEATDQFVDILRRYV